MKKNNISTDLENYLYKYNQIQQLMNEVMHYGNCYIIGWALRKYKENHRFNDIRDVDIVYKPLTSTSLMSYAVNIIVKQINLMDIRL